MAFGLGLVSVLLGLVLLLVGGERLPSSVQNWLEALPNAKTLAWDAAWLAVLCAFSALVLGKLSGATLASKQDQAPLYTDAVQDALFILGLLVESGDLGIAALWLGLVGGVFALIALFVFAP